MLIFPLFLLLSVLIIVALLFIAGRLGPAIAGWLLLGVGLLIIDGETATVRPFDDDGAADFMAGIVLFILRVWGAVLAGFLLFRARMEGARPPEPRAWLQWARCWSVPVAFLLAAAFLHWLSNRLAGASPAWQVHLLVLLPALAIAGAVFWLNGRTLIGIGRVRRFAFALPAAFAAIVLWDVHKGFDLMSEAEAFAAGRTWCVMTYGGSERRRPATSGFDLSPLVNRAYGNWAAEKTLFLTIEAEDGMRGYRRVGGIWDSHPLVVQPDCTLDRSSN